jgi:hypothetical protein
MPFSKWPIEVSRTTWEDNIKMDLDKIVCKVVNLTEMALVEFNGGYADRRIILKYILRK